jgi:hypothetical protein
MEEEPIEAIGTASTGPRAVHRVAGDGMTDRREMDPDLVCPAGDEVELEQRPAIEAFPHPIAGRRRTTRGHDRHPRPMARVPPDRRFDPSHCCRHGAMDEGEIRLLDTPRLELGHDRGLGDVRLRHDEQPARIAIEAVDDPGAADPGNPAEGVAMATQERIDEGPVLMARRGMDDQPRRLVDDQQVRVLVDDRDLDRCVADWRRRRGRRHLDANRRARRDDRVGLERLTIGGDPARRDEALDEAPGKTREIGGEAIGSAVSARGNDHRSNIVTGRRHQRIPGISRVPPREPPGGPPAGGRGGRAARSRS